mmetsp:Transcript_7595/g.23466  ORF Transcript_7595/g.23466 Transcript_7595/m.23466 type:complete len:297 (+) Transcript_7595:797-1687(+)
MASTEPDVSALTRTGKVRFSWMPPPCFLNKPASLRCLSVAKDLNVTSLNLAALTSVAMASRASATFLAVCSSSATTKASPADGMRDVSDCQPTTWTADEGSATSTLRPSSSNKARTRPNATPAANGSPIFSCPRLTSVVATTPSPLSTCASTTTPDARRASSKFAFKSNNSACNNSFSNRSSTPSLVLALTRANIVSPPYSSGTKSYPISSFSTLEGSASWASILFTATTTGTPAAFAQAMESIVCALTPSSAATTSTTTSVQLAPRSRISEKAAWPGVSKNVTALCSSSVRTCTE